MPKARLTRTSVEKLELYSRQVEYFDTKLTGFAVRVNATCRTYFVQCRVKGRTDAKGRQLEVKETIGRVGVIDFEDAIARAKTILEDAANGISPADRRQERQEAEQRKVQEAKEQEALDVTLQEVFDKYKATRKDLKKSTADLYDYLLKQYLSDWLPLPIRSIDAKMVVSRHSEIGSNSPSMADGAMRVLRAIFNFAMGLYEDVIVKNPVSKLSALNAWYNVERKQTFIKPTDLKAWLSSALNLGYDTSRDYLLTLLFTGARREEAAALQWQDVDLAAGVVIFRDTKTGKPLEVPLCRYLLDIYQQRKKYYFAGPESFVFPSYGVTGHITECFEALDVIYQKSGVKATHHDLRRSFISYCEELEVPPLTKKRLVNHAIPRDVTDGYTQFTIGRLREVVEKVAAFILHKAEIPYHVQSVPALSSEQAGQITGSEFWQTLSEEQKVAFGRMLAPQAKIDDSKVISLEAMKVKRRIKAA